MHVICPGCDAENLFFNYSSNPSSFPYLRNLITNLISLPTCTMCCIKPKFPSLKFKTLNPNLTSPSYSKGEATKIEKEGENFFPEP